MVTLHSLLPYNSLRVGPHLAMELFIVALFGDQILGFLCAILLDCSLNSKPHISGCITFLS